MTARLFDEVRKDATLGDVHVRTALGNEKPKKKPKEDDVGKAWSVSVPIMKTDDELRVAYGWASVISENGQTVTDVQGDQIETAELVKAAHDFMRTSRAAGEMHFRSDAGDIVESIIFTPEIQKSLGIDLGKIGWFIGAHVPGDAEWAAVKSGKYAAFSIGGSASPVDI